ncbi:hypothetical protein K502DRAFT_339409 [Neoconidiobolus thromboides FSU 785]|nr:hypothetical protein K502DRAFT_339409 [Neoconidiobolus thromboides FSU 785]
MKSSFFALSFLSLVIFTNSIVSDRWKAMCSFETRVQYMDAVCSCSIRSPAGGTAGSKCYITRQIGNVQYECSGPRDTSSQGGYQIEMKSCGQGQMEVQMYGPNGEEWSSHTFVTDCAIENKRRSFKRYIKSLFKRYKDNDAAIEFNNNSCNANHEFDVMA